MKSRSNDYREITPPYVGTRSTIVLVTEDFEKVLRIFLWSIILPSAFM